MPSRSLLAAALVATGALAAPSVPFVAHKRDRPSECPVIDGQNFISEVSFYTDSECTDFISSVCYNTGLDASAGPGAYSCEPGLLPTGTPFYGKVVASDYPDVQLLFTRDQSCPPNGPGAVFVTLIDNANCVQFNLGGDTPGQSVYPNGGADIAREDQREIAPAKLTKRDDSCSGFNIESQQTSYSNTVQISNIVDCTNSADAGCTIEVGSEHTESVTTSYSVTAGGGIEGLFEVSATFGMDYTESSTTTMQEGFSVAPGQMGYLSAYSGATLFKGTFTGCDSGNDQPGQALVIKKNAFTYSVVYTGA